MWLLAKAFMFLYDHSQTVRAVVVTHQNNRQAAATKAAEEAAKRHHDRLRELYGNTKFNEFKRKGLV